MWKNVWNYRKTVSHVEQYFKILFVSVYIIFNLSVCHFRYCWVSPFLTDTKTIPKEITPDCMIPMCDNDVDKPKLLIGHNVAFDRSYVQEPYQLKVQMFFNKFVKLFQIF